MSIEEISYSGSDLLHPAIVSLHITGA